MHHLQRSVWEHIEISLHRRLLQEEVVHLRVPVKQVESTVYWRGR